jgi:hypothetical protein
MGLRERQPGEAEQREGKLVGCSTLSKRVDAIGPFGWLCDISFASP